MPAGIQGLEPGTGDSVALAAAQLPGVGAGPAVVPAATAGTTSLPTVVARTSGDVRVGEGALQGSLTQAPLPGQGALSSAVRTAVDASDDPHARAAGVTLMAKVATGRGSASAGVATLHSPDMQADADVLLRGVTAAAEAPVVDPTVSQRGAAVLQAAAEDGHRGRADAGLRQLLAGVSLDRAGDAQRLDLAMSGQAMSARASVEGEADAGMLLASLQRSVNEARKDVHPGARGPDSAAPIAGAGAAVQSVPGPDQSGRPAAMLNLLATPADPEFAPEFAGRLQMMVKNGMREASVQLHPAELGRLQLTVSTDGDQARIAIVAETSAARDMIENSLPRLRDMLEQSGLQLAQGDVSQRQSDSGTGAAGALGAESGPGAAEESEGERAISISALPPDRLLDAYV